MVTVLKIDDNNLSLFLFLRRSWWFRTWQRNAAIVPPHDVPTVPCYTPGS